MKPDLPNDSAAEPRAQAEKPKTNSNLVILAVIIGVCLFIFLFAQFFYGSSSSSKDTTAPTPYSAALICSDCADAGININVWQNAGVSRGKVVFSVPHNTIVSVIGNKVADDGRTWYKVEYRGQTGWIAQDFVNR